MSLQARLIAALLALVAAFCAGMKTMAHLRDSQANEALVKAQQEAAEVKDQWAQSIARNAQEHANEVAKISADRDAALERLRQRPQRMPQPARAACQGATGAELSGQDSEFLTRLGAEADEVRSRLAECEAWIDAVKHPK